MLPLRCRYAAVALPSRSPYAVVARVIQVPEPVLAAQAAASELGELAAVERLGVYFLGGRSFDFSVVRRTAGGGAGGGDEGGDVPLEWSVEVSRWAPLLGGEGIDEALVDHLVGGFKREHGIDLSRDHLALQAASSDGYSNRSRL